MMREAGQEHGLNIHQPRFEPSPHLTDQSLERFRLSIGLKQPQYLEHVPGCRIRVGIPLRLEAGIAFAHVVQ